MRTQNIAFKKKFRHPKKLNRRIKIQKIQNHYLKKCIAIINIIQFLLFIQKSIIFSHRSITFLLSIFILL